MKRLQSINDFRVNPITPIFPTNNNQRPKEQTMNNKNKQPDSDSFQSTFEQELNKTNK